MHWLTSITVASVLVFTFGVRKGIPACTRTGWVTFEDWGACSKSCDIGMRSRAKTDNCGKAGQDLEPCNHHQCPDDPATCQWGFWEDWSACTKSCEMGTQQRMRYTFSTYGNDTCTNWERGHQHCNHAHCPGTPPCVFGDWTQWGDCNKPCGLGMRARTRQRITPSEETCVGDSQELQHCNHLSCPQPWRGPNVTCLEELSVRKFFLDRHVGRHMGDSWSTQMVRLVFHDAIDFNNIEPVSSTVNQSVVGGIDFCLMAGRRKDGTIDIGHNDNMIHAFRKLQRSIGGSAGDTFPAFSVADLAMAGATVTIEENTNGPYLGHIWGRKDMTFEQCKEVAGLVLYPNAGVWHTSNSATHYIKNSPDGTSFKPEPLLSVFNHLNFTTKDAVALFGAHSIGMIGFCASAHRHPHKGEYCDRNRAYHIRDIDGANTTQFDHAAMWDQTPDCFDNLYYRSFSNALYEAANSCCGTCSKKWDAAPNWCQNPSNLHDNKDSATTTGQQCELGMAWCRGDSIAPGFQAGFFAHGRDYSGYQVLMKSMRDYAFTDSKMTDQFGPHANLNPKGVADWGQKKGPLVRTAPDWALIGDTEAKSYVQEFAASELSFFDGFSAAWSKLQRMTPSTDLQQCTAVECVFDGSSFVCQDVIFPLDSHACTAPAKGETCALTGGIGARGIITCGVTERVCCRDEGCPNVLRAWQHRTGAPVEECSVPGIVGNSAVQNNEAMANMAPEDLINSCPLPPEFYSFSSAAAFVGMRND